MKLKCRSQNFLNAILASAYSIYANKPIILYGEPFTGKSTLVKLISNIDNKFKLHIFNKNSKISKLEAIIDKQDSLIFLYNFNEWHITSIEHLNSLINKIKGFLIYSISISDIKKAYEFFHIHKCATINAQFIYVPALRERKEDLVMLAEDVINETAIKYKISSKQLSKSAKFFIQDYPWYGNFNEFNNVLKSSLFNSKGKYINEEDILKHIKIQPELKNKAISDLNNYIREVIKDYAFSKFEDNSSLYLTFMQEAEKILIEFSLKHTNNLKEAANFLGISPNTFRKKYSAIQ